MSDSKLQAAFAAERAGDSLARQLSRAKAVARLFGDEAEQVCIGRYRVRRTVGRGAMGRVYAAEDPTLGREVALKVLASTDVEPSLLEERLRVEARALGALSHPGIVTILGIERTSDGRVCLAMELLEGPTLRSWAREQPRSVLDVLGCFASLAEALAAAHADGVLHGDFKPDNVVVTTDGPKILDFGLARTVWQASIPIEEDRSTTQPGAGTPAYMAPELRRGAPGDERSDQFAFFVALHEVLVGDYPPMSIAYGEGSDVRSAAGSVPAGARRMLRQGLRPDPDARFDDMRDVAERLRSLARAPPRRRAPYVLGVAAASAGAAMWWSGEDEQRCEAPAGIEDTWGPQARANLQQNFLDTGLPYAAHAASAVSADLDAFAEAWTSRRDDVCSLTRADANRGDALRSCLEAHRTALEVVIDSLVDADTGAVQRSIATVRRLDSPRECGDEKKAEERPKPASLVRAKALIDSGRAEEALQVLDQHGEPRVDDAPASVVAEWLYRRGQALDETGRPADAAQMLTQAYWFSQTHHQDRWASAASIYLVAVSGERLARYDEALQWARHAEAALLRIGTPPDDRGALSNNVGAVEYRHGRYPEARRHIETAIEAWERVHGPDDPAVADAVSNLAAVRTDQGDLEGGIVLSEDALARRRRALGDDHPDVATSHHNLGVTIDRTGRHEDALPHLEAGLALRQRVLRSQHPELVSSHVAVGHACSAMGRYDEAEDHYLKARTIREASLPDDHPMAGAPIAGLAGLAFYKEDYATAARLYREAVELEERRLGPEHPSVGVQCMNLAAVLGRQERYAESITWYERALGAFETTLGPDHLRVGFALTGMGTALRLSGEIDRACDVLERGLAVLGASDLDDAELSEARISLAQCLWAREGDRARDRIAELAGRARSGLQADPRHHQSRTELEEWLDEIGVSPS